MNRKVFAESVTVDEIILDGQPVQLRNEDVPIEEIKLDITNPRIINSGMLDASSKSETDFQRKIEEKLWEDSNVHELYRQILVNGGLIERIFVKEAGTVIEGNCRTVAYRRLHQQHPNDPKWKKIPARVLPPNISDRQIVILQGEMHVAGKIKWSTFEKAGHVWRLHHEFLMPQEEIAQRLRMSKSKANQLIRAFETMQHKYMKKYPGPASIYKFSYFEEFFKRPAIRTQLAKLPNLVDRFVDWVGIGKIPEARHVRDLPDILENPDAANALENAGYVAAMRVLEQDNPAITSALFRAMERLIIELQDARVDEIQEVRRGNKPAVRMIKNVFNELERFMELCGIEIKELKDE